MGMREEWCIYKIIDSRAVDMDKRKEKVRVHHHQSAAVNEHFWR
jgi:hypothetical protein